MSKSMVQKSGQKGSCIVDQRCSFHSNSRCMRQRGGPQPIRVHTAVVVMQRGAPGQQRIKGQWRHVFPDGAAAGICSSTEGTATPHGCTTPRCTVVLANWFLRKGNI